MAYRTLVWVLLALPTLFLCVSASDFKNRFFDAFGDPCGGFFASLRTAFAPPLRYGLSNEGAREGIYGLKPSRAPSF